jgi:hypothetical protein
MNTDTKILTIEEVDAKELTIKTALGVAAEEMTALWRGRAWEVKGYSTWTEYLKGSGLTVAWADASTRQGIVADLRKEGMSTRAIADAVGADDKTVRNDLKSGAEYSAPAAPITGLDGKTYQPTQPKPPADLSEKAATAIQARMFVRSVEAALVGLLSNPVHGIEEYLEVAGDQFLVTSDWSTDRRAQAHERLDLLFDLMNAR